MFDALARHGRMDVTLSCAGDLDIDDHHTAEDCALALGEAFDKALGDKRGVRRFGEAHVPLDEALARAAVDLSGRPFAHVDLGLRRERVGDIAAEMIGHALSSFAMAARLTLHVELIRGQNDHHRAEAAFKALALALCMAVADGGPRRHPQRQGRAVSGRESSSVAREQRIWPPFSPACGGPAARPHGGASRRGARGESRHAARRRRLRRGQENLRASGMAAPLRERMAAGKPTLSICVGLQLLCRTSEESPGVAGLGLVDAAVTRFPDSVRAPQFGWNRIDAAEGSAALTSGHAYFANSYRLAETPAGWSAAIADHGGPFVAAMERGAVVACQFHPELSGAYGRSLLERWIARPC